MVIKSNSNGTQPGSVAKSFVGRSCEVREIDWFTEGSKRLYRAKHMG